MCLAISWICRLGVRRILELKGDIMGFIGPRQRGVSGNGNSINRIPGNKRRTTTLVRIEIASAKVVRAPVS